MAYNTQTYGQQLAQLIEEQAAEDAAKRAPDLRQVPNAFANCADEAAVEDLLAALTLEHQS